MKVSGNQKAQHDFLWDLAQGESLYVGGVGSGKTWAGSRKLLLLHQRNQCPGLVVAPTYGDLHRFVLPALFSALTEWRWPFRDQSRSDAPSVVVGDHPIWCLSAEDPRRFAGFEVGHAWVDEAARVKSSEDPLRDAPTQIRSRIRGFSPSPWHRLHLLLTTTPEGLDTWVQRDFFDRPLPGTRWYRGRTAANSALPPGYVQSLMATFSADVAAQYLEGLAVDVGGDRAHPGFIRAANVRDVAEEKSRPYHLGADYNVDPMAWILAQYVGDELRVIDELYLTGGTTVDSAVYEANAKGWGRGVVHLHPDKSSKSRSTTGDSEFVCMAATAKSLGWRHTGSAAGANPPVAARIANLSRLILAADGRRRLVVHPRCERVIAELERTRLLRAGGYDPGDNGDRGHILDALGYVAWAVTRPPSVAGAVTIPGL